MSGWPDHGLFHRKLVVHWADGLTETLIDDFVTGDRDDLERDALASLENRLAPFN